MDYVGIAAADRFKSAPRGLYPTDFLPGARSVVSMAIKINKGAQLTMIRGFASKELRHLTSTYRWFFGGGLSNHYFMDMATLLVTRLLEEEGHVVVPIPAAGVGGVPFSHRYAAVAAGLGEVGWNGLFMTPDNGPRQRLVSLITTANLDPDPMYSGPKLCDVEKCKELGQGIPLCVKTCPMHAFLSDGKLELTIEGHSLEFARLNDKACTKVHLAFVENPNRHAPIPLRAEFASQVELEQLIFKRTKACGFCIFSCPVGSPKDIGDAIDLELKRRS